MKLSGLEDLYRGMKKNKETYYLFCFRKNRVTFDVLFDIFYEPFKLVFICKNSSFYLGLEVKRGFIINTFLENSVKEDLRRILDLTFDPNNPFSTNSFFEEFNSKIPTYSFRDIKQNRELLPFYKNEIEESDKLYYDGIIEWNKNSCGKKQTSKNLEKTRVLYPALYELCKRENISVRYTSEKNSDESSLINGLFDVYQK